MKKSGGSFYPEWVAVFIRNRWQVSPGMGGSFDPEYARNNKKCGDDMISHEKLADRITIDPQIMVGKPVIRGLRITVEQLLKALANGISEEDLIEEYPELEKKDFQAIYAYVAELVESEKVFPVKLPA